MRAIQFVGIDVSKAVLDEAVRPSGETWQAANDAAGVAAWEASHKTAILYIGGGVGRAERLQDSPF